jgi:hypothetical protein
MLIKIHDSYRLTVALCDENLIGKKFEKADEKTQLDLTGTFFQGNVKSQEEIKEIVLGAKTNDATFNAVGKESCDLLISLNLISKKDVIRISDIPVAIILM